MLEKFKKKFGKKKDSFQEKELKCPRCGIVMDKLRKDGVVIDNCSKCKGLWLDDKEIDKLVSLAKKKEGDDDGK
ncbi:MAG: zf-TFIIB domain-containing protein [Nanobdellota archaeon]